MQQTWMALQVPNATIVKNGPYWGVSLSRVTGTGMVNCAPAVWIDDQASEFEQLAMVPKDALAVIEFYSHVASVPLRYGGSARAGKSANWVAQQSDPGGPPTVTGGSRPPGLSSSTLTRGDCGVILAWTKAFLFPGNPRH